MNNQVVAPYSFIAKDEGGADSFSILAVSSKITILMPVKSKCFASCYSMISFGKLKTSKWAKITKCSHDTANRDIQDLISKYTRIFWFEIQRAVEVQHIVFLIIDNDLVSIK